MSKGSRTAKRVYRIPQPAATQEAGATVLRFAALPLTTVEACASEASSPHPRAGILSYSHSTSHQTSRHMPTGGRELFDALAFLPSLYTATLTDADAEAIVYPYHANPYTWDDVYAALRNRLTETAASVAWYRPRDRPGWDTDIRFLGGWWVSLRDPDSAAAQLARVGMRVVDTASSLTDLRPRRGEVNRPFILPEERTVWAEDQLVADLALRMHGRLFRLDILHVDELAMTPDRVQVLLFLGVADTRRREMERALGRQTQKGSSEVMATEAMERTNETRLTAPSGEPADTGANVGSHYHLDNGALTVDVGSANACGGIASAADGTVATQFQLETLSLSACSVGTASLLVLLTALAVMAEFENCVDDSEISTSPRGRMTPLANLDLSYNALTSESLNTFTMLLPRTEVRRLSLRGNGLTGGNSAATRDFLIEGCSQLEELDLSHTQLSVQQICILIEVLPRMSHLHVLNLDGLNVPVERTSALLRAIAQSQLWSLSLNGCAACAGTAFLSFTQAACEKHRNKALGGGCDLDRSQSATGYFDTFFSASRVNGWVPPDTRALPEGYGCFTNNDPSLFT